MSGERDRERGCVRAREWASQRLDGELSELERLLLRRHLGRCPDCRAFADGIAQVAAELRTAPVEEPSRPLVPVTVPDRAPRRPAGPRRRRLAVAVALVVVSGTLGGLLGGLLGGGESPRPVTTIVELPPPPTETVPTGNV